MQRTGKNGQVKKAKISGAAAACVVAVDCFTFAEYDFKKKREHKKPAFYRQQKRNPFAVCPRHKETKNLA